MPGICPANINPMLAHGWLICHKDKLNPKEMCLHANQFSCTSTACRNGHFCIMPKAQALGFLLCHRLKIKKDVKLMRWAESSVLLAHLSHFRDLESIACFSCGPKDFLTSKRAKEKACRCAFWNKVIIMFYLKNNSCSMGKELWSHFLYLSVLHK